MNSFGGDTVTKDPSRSMSGLKMMGHLTEATPITRRVHSQRIMNRKIVAIYGIEPDAHTVAVNKWRQSCAPDEELPSINWATLASHDVPEKLAMRIAWKLTERGAALDTWHPGDIIRHLHAIAVEKKRVVADTGKTCIFQPYPSLSTRFYDVGVRRPGGT